MHSEYQAGCFPALSSQRNSLRGRPSKFRRCQAFGNGRRPQHNRFVFFKFLFHSSFVNRPCARRSSSNFFTSRLKSTAQPSPFHGRMTRHLKLSSNNVSVNFSIQDEDSSSQLNTENRPRQGPQIITFQLHPPSVAANQKQIQQRNSPEITA